MIQFPVELQVHIIQYLSVPSLSILAQTNRHLNTLCNPRLFQNVNLNSYQQLQKIPLKNQSLALFVETVSLNMLNDRWALVKDVDIAPLANCIHLTQLEIEDCELIHDRPLVSIFHHCPNLKHVSLSGCIKITDQTVVALASHCTQIVVLDLNKLHLITDSSIEQVASRCRELESLSIAGTHCTNKTLVTLVKECYSNLAFLDISSCFNMIQIEEWMETVPEWWTVETNSLAVGEVDWEDLDSDEPDSVMAQRDAETLFEALNELRNGYGNDPAFQAERERLTHLIEEMLPDEDAYAEHWDSDEEYTDEEEI